MAAPFARETFLVVRFAQRRHHLALDVVVARGTLGAEVLLIVGSAVVGAVFGEEAAVGEGAAAYFTLETLRVEVFVLDAEHFAAAFLLARGAQRFSWKKGGM